MEQKVMSRERHKIVYRILAEEFFEKCCLKTEDK
jgi:hypothetical protein